MASRAVRRAATSLSGRRWQTTSSEVPQAVQSPNEPVASTSSSSSSSPTTTPSQTPRSRKVKSASSQSGKLEDVLEEWTPLSRTHEVHVATLHLRSYNDAVPKLTFFTSFAMRAAKALGLPTSNIVMLPTKTTLFTVPRSPFAHKKSQENFWRKEHKRAIKVYDGNEQLVEAWFAYLRKQAMPGVGMKAQLFNYRPLGWAKSVTTESDSSTGGDSSLLREEGTDTDKQKVEQMAKQLEKELAQGLSESDK